ncbi:hypothetical protein Tco_0715813 [Tanacetum coccineum]
MLNGAPLASWETKSNEPSTGKRSMIWNSNERIELILEKSLDLFDEPEIKQCYLDLGLFPEDQRIAATTLMDMWVHLYNHDKEGSATLDKLFRLSTKNLATLLPISENLAAVDQHCEGRSWLMQTHDENTGYSFDQPRVGTT